MSRRGTLRLPSSPPSGAGTQGPSLSSRSFFPRLGQEIGKGTCDSPVRNCRGPGRWPARPGARAGTGPKHTRQSRQRHAQTLPAGQGEGGGGSLGFYLRCNSLAGGGGLFLADLSRSSRIGSAEGAGRGGGSPGCGDGAPSPVRRPLPGRLPSGVPRPSRASSTGWLFLGSC